MNDPSPIQMHPLLGMIALAHSVEGVTLQLSNSDGDRLIVARHRLDADLDPCQLRHLLLHDLAAGNSGLITSVVEARIVVGLEDMGGGLYRRTTPAGEERWFATWLSHATVLEIFRRCPLELGDAAIRVSTFPDLGLGVTAVDLVARHPASVGHLDVLASWAVASVMVLELITSAQGTTSSEDHRPSSAPQHWGNDGG